MNLIASSRRRHLRPRGAVLAGAVLAAATLLSGTASAHVTVDSLGTAAAGDFAKIVFSVPNERDDAGTVALKVQMPQDAPLIFVSVAAKPGWEVQTTTRTLDTPIEMFGSSYDSVVDTVTWTATGDTRIAPGQFDQFWLSVGPLPSDVESVSFPSIQIYESGEEVAWIEAAGPDGAEPEHPAPTLALGAGASGEQDAAVPTTVTVAGSSSEDGGDDGDGLAIAALIVGALGLVVGLAAFVTRPKRAATT